MFTFDVLYKNRKTGEADWRRQNQPNGSPVMRRHSKKIAFV
jgi:hypothetical protein